MSQEHPLNERRKKCKLWIRDLITDNFTITELNKALYGEESMSDAMADHINDKCKEIEEFIK